MSDNLDVVPQESVVDGPDNYEATEAPAAEITEEEEGPVSLDDIQPDEDEGEELDFDDGEEGAEVDEDGDGEDDAEPETIEFNFGGNKLEVPKDSIPEELAAKIEEFSSNTWSDYTKKSQANTETAKQLEQRQQALTRLETLQSETLEAYSVGRGIKAEIEQLNAINMQALWQSDPDRARQLTDLKAQKSAQLQDIIAQVDQREAQYSHERQQEVERLANEGREILDRKIKGFSKEIAPKLVDYVVQNYGMPVEQANEWSLNPNMTEMAYKAMKFDEMQKAARSKTTAKKQSAPVRSVSKGTKGTAVMNDPSRMSMEQYVAWRNGQGKK